LPCHDVAAWNRRWNGGAPVLPDPVETPATRGGGADPPLTVLREAGIFNSLCQFFAEG
jgi:hypothetical protein